MTELLDLAQLRTRIGAQEVGCQLELHSEIDSTNSRAKFLASCGAPHGTVVIAETQTAGRGRLNRRWHAPVGSSLLLSVVLRPSLGARQAQRATMLCSLAVIEAIRETCQLEARVKWPNDILLGGRKVGGILTELGLKGQALDYAIVGMGLNVNLSVLALPEVMTPATSLSEQAGREIDRMTLLVALLQHIDEGQARLAQGWSPHEAWSDCLATLGEQVSVGTTEQVIYGVAVGVDEDGALLIRQASGDVVSILVGDVTLRGHRVNPTA